MCEYCEQGQTMMEVDVIDRANFGWGYDDEVKLTLREAENDPTKLAIFIDRGFLRMVILADCQCIEGGEKFEIKFCPNCGDKIQAL